MGILLKKFIISIIGLSVLLQPFAVFADIEDGPIAGSNEQTVSLSEAENADKEAGFFADGGDDTEVTEVPKISQVAKDLSSRANTSDDDLFSLQEQILGLKDARIIIGQEDMNKIRSLYCISSIIPDFQNDIDQLYNLLPAEDRLPSDLKPRPASKDDLLKIKFEDPALFALYVNYAVENWKDKGSAKEILLKKVNEVIALRDYIERNASVDPETTRQYIQQATESVKSLSCLSGMDVNTLINQPVEYIREVATSNLDALVIDVRILKTLVYLVTPKNQGGAGHWRIRVRKITQVGKPYSTESDATRTSLGGSSQTSSSTSSSSCSEEMTAAQCSQYLSENEDQQEEESNLVVEDRNGDQYYASIEDNEALEYQGLENEIPERNLSAHKDGQAIDISEIDDIRCTLIKKRRMLSDKKEKKTIKPIKLAWQTQKGYNESGGNSTDLMGLMKDIASDSIRDMVDGLGGDITDYEGNLSDANFNDVVGILGKSIFAQLISSSEIDLSGINVEDTLRKLGGMYFSDYLGLPREVFANVKFETLDDLESLIGQTALEKKVGLPYGSLSSYNVLASRGTDKPTYDLEGTILNIGLRKLEYEANLNSHDLDGYISGSGSTTQDSDLYIGKKVIEKELNLSSGTFAGSSFSALRENLGKYKFDLLFADTSYIDNAVHVEAGTAKQLKSGQLTPDQFAIKIGRTRKDDTLNGLNYFAANNAAYNIPDISYDAVDADGNVVKEGVWDKAVKGEKIGFLEIGKYTLSRLFAVNSAYSSKFSAQTNGFVTEDDLAKINDKKLSVSTNPNDLGVSAFNAWLGENIGKTSENDCKISTDPIAYQLNDVKITKSYTETNQIDERTMSLNVDISEEKALGYGLHRNDIYRMFGCGRAKINTVFESLGSKLLYYGLTNYLLNDQEKVKIELENLEPELRFTNSTLKFYSDRITNIDKIADKIQSDWQDKLATDEFGEISRQINTISNTISNSNVSLADIKGLTKLAGEISHNIDELKLDYEQLLSSSNEDAVRINITILDLNELIHNITEIFEGDEVKTADMVQFEQVKKIEINNNGNESGANDNADSVSKGKISPTLIFDFLARRISASMLALRIGSSKAENELGLPYNSLLYLVQNYEKAGIKSKDSIYLAIGQAKIEDQFNMPAFYFQGNEITKGMPDFSNVENISEFLKYTRTQFSYYQDKALEEGFDKTIVSDDSKFFTFLKGNLYLRSIFDNLVDLAKEGYQTEKSIHQGHLISDINLEEVEQNIEDKGFADGIRSPGKDIMMRMGFSGERSALKNYFNSMAVKRSGEIDQKLDLKDGTTQALITEEQVKLTDGSQLLSQDEKNQLTAPFYYAAAASSSQAEVGYQSNFLNEEALGVFLKLINGDISLNEIGSRGLAPGYVSTNPYLAKPQDTEDSCPIDYVQVGSGEGTFKVNTITPKQGNYCIYDKAGNTCLESESEALRYIANHTSDQYGDVLDVIASSIVKNFAGNPGMGDVNAIKQKLSDFIERKTNLVFSDDFWEMLEQNNLDQKAPAAGYEVRIPVEILRKIFTRSEVETPLKDYKLAVGKITAQSAISWQLFNSLGLDVDPSLFDASDLYDILSGNYKSLYRLGSAMLEKSLNLNPGTIELIVTASNPSNLKCAVAGAGSTLLGNYFGVGSIPIRIDRGTNVVEGMMQNIGQAKVEEALGLPQGTFYGSTKGLNEIINRIKPINFALMFNVPLTIERQEDGIIKDAIGSSDGYLSAFMGSEKAESLETATGPYKLRQVLSLLSSYPGITQEQAQALSNIDKTVQASTEKFLQDYAAGQVEIPAEISESKADYYSEVKDFKNFIAGIDSLFDLPQYTTIDLLKGVISPNEYNKKVGSKIATDKMVAEGLGTLFNLNDEQAEAAKDLAVNFGKFFKCSSPSTTSAFGIGGGGCNDERYQNFNLFYQNLNTIFDINLDDKANLKPGSFERMLKNPDRAFVVLMDNTAEKLDAQLGLPKDGSAIKFSFRALYSRYASWSEENYETNKVNDIACRNEAEQSYGDTYDNLRIQKHNNDQIIKAGKKSDATDAQRQSASEAEAGNIIINSKIQSLNNSIHGCKGYNHDNHGFDVWEETADIVKEGLVRDIRDKIINLEVDGTNVGVDMPITDIQQLVFEGDMTYFQIAGMAMVVNYVQNQEDGSKRSTRPEFRISYNDIKQAFYPDQSAVNAARDAATWAYFRVDADGNPDPEAVDNSRVTTGYNNLCPSGDTVSSLLDCSQAGSPGGTYANIVGDNITASQQRYGVKIDEANPVITAQEGLNRLNDNSEAQRELQQAQDEAVRHARKEFKQSLEYRMMDQVLSDHDQNIFPGFARAMFSGDGKIRSQALTTYIKNGLRNGHIAGVRFDGVEEINLWLEVSKFVTDYFSGDSAQKQNLFSDFSGGSAFSWLSNFISDNSENWFGFELDGDMAQGLLVGAFTGKWGNFNVQDPNDYYTGKGGKQIPTFGTAIKTWGLSRVFSWADKALNLDAGMAYKMFDMGKNLYTVTKSYRQLRNVKDVSNLSQAQLDYVRKVNNLKPDQIPTEEQRQAAQLKKKAQLQELKVQFVTFVVTYFFDQWAGEGIAKLEEKYGLTPGSLMVVADAAVGVGVASIAVNYYGMNASILSNAVQGLYVALAIFVIMNLFGYYKTEYKCTADGYWPAIESPQYSVVDVANIGVWNGTDNSQMEKKSIEAAQYKARRLIVDILSMQNSGDLYKDVIPSQIMTGRKEDVEFANALIQTNLCDHIGLDSVGGVCGGNTRAGVWENPQTVAWTHIGF